MQWCTASMSSSMKANFFLPWAMAFSMVPDWARMQFW